MSDLNSIPTLVAAEANRVKEGRTKLRAHGVTLGAMLPEDNITEMAVRFQEMENQGAVQAEVAPGETYTIPAGVHNGSGTVSGVTSTGEPGYQLQQKTVTPTKSQQNVTPDAPYFGLSAVTVEPIPPQYQDVSDVTAQAGQVLEGQVFVNAAGQTVTGALANRSSDGDIPLDGMLVEYVTIPAGYYDGTTRVYLTSSIADALAEI